MKPQRLDLDYRIVWKSQWHIGSGYGSATANRLQRRDGEDGAPIVPDSQMKTDPAPGCTPRQDGAPIVPGSQMKGVLRHQCERLVQALGGDAIDPHAGTEDDDRRLIENFVPLAKSELLVDRLFGSRRQGECLFVTNAVPESPKNTYPTDLRTRTAIDRVTGTVREGHLFTTELAESDIKLAGNIRARHPAGILTQDLTKDEPGFPYEYALLVAGLLSLDALGGDKSAGLGRCEVTVVEDSVRWNGCPISLKESLESFYEEEEWGEMLKLLREEPPS